MYRVTFPILGVVSMIGGFANLDTRKPAAGGSWPDSSLLAWVPTVFGSSSDAGSGSFCRLDLNRRGEFPICPRRNVPARTNLQ